MEEANALKLELVRRGISVFLCNIPPGKDIGRSVIHALSNCKLAVILGTRTYGAKTLSGFSTNEELRYIINEKKPYFLAKMCDTFDEPETRFRLPPEISYYKWQPNGSQRSRVPSDLVEQIVRRLAAVGTDRPSPRVSAAPSPASPTATPAAQGHSAQPAAAAEPSSDVTVWLARLSLSDFQPALNALHACSLHDVKFAVSKGYIDADRLAVHKLPEMRIARFLDEASKVRRGAPERERLMG